MTDLGFNDAWRHEHKARNFDVAGDFNAVGATVIRYPWVWNTETDDELFAGIAEAMAGGLRPILCPYSYENLVVAKDVDAYLALMTELRGRYPALTLEVLNETNLDHYGGYTAEQYAWVFQAVRNAVGGPLMISGGAVGSAKVYVNPWVETVSRLTHGSYRVSIHCYVDREMATADPMQGPRNVIATTRMSYPRRKLVCTEFGYSSVFGEAEQAQVLGGMLAELERQEVEAACVHRLYDYPRSYYSDDRVAGWGVKRPDGSWKPAAAKL